MTQTRILLAGALITLLFINALIINKEIDLANSIEVKIPLAPVDPRSLMQGDYMRLHYKIDRSIVGEHKEGQLIVTLDSDGFAKKFELYNNEILENNQHLLNFSAKKYRDLHIASESFLFEEDRGDYYAKATHAILNLTPSGTTLLKDLYVPLKHIKKEALKDN
jgi:uncharacterized membrane-anchored protein